MRRIRVGCMAVMVLALGLAACSKKSQEGSEGTVAAPAVVNPDAATLKGVVRFTASPPGRNPLTLRGTPECALQHKGEVLSEDVMVKEGKLANVVIYVKSGLEGKSIPAPTGVAELDQLGCLFKPHVMVAQVQQPVRFKNSDSILHNVNVQAKINKKLNIGLPVQGSSVVKKFDQPEIGMRLICDVHPWMVSSLSILPHPYFAVSREDGSFEIGNLPPGKYVIEARHETLGAKTATLNVAAKEAKTVNFSF